MDLPGHGRTELHQNKYEILDFVHFIREFMDTLKIERAHLIGHSLGGAIAARFALTYPEKVEKLILVSSAGLGRELGFGLRLMTINGLGEMITRPKFNNMKNSLKLLVYDKKVITNEIVEMMCETSYLPGTQSSYLKILRRNATILGQRKSQYEPILQGLSQFKNSVLLIWGRQDGFVPIWHAYRAAKILQNSQIIIFENCGHLPMYEHTTNFNSAVADFLKVE
jgi:4,5:9,10-diseco-3-hydroxy-5,9,17-trioxoandrosta-1(10),2-diene-4-oate hydrolase